MERLRTYTLMHEDDVVAVSYVEEQIFDIRMPNKLPFGLRYANNKVTCTDFDRWLTARVNNLQRTYMPKVYAVRKVGRDRDAVLRDSCAVSVTDNFWIARSDVDVTWGELCSRRDRDTLLIDTALKGVITVEQLRVKFDGETSLFTLKGAFPKAIKNGCMLKLGGNAQYEYVTYVIGKALGISVAEANIVTPSLFERRLPSGAFSHKAVGDAVPDDTLVSVSLFTTTKRSLVHLAELLSAVGYKGNDWHAWAYDNAPDDFKRQFERLYMLNWLVSNVDMHGENFGYVYDPDKFEFINVAPSFDHNGALFVGEPPDLDVPPIVEPNVRRHLDVIGKIKSGALDKALDEVQYWLTDEQKEAVRKVARHFVALAENAPEQSE